MSLPQAGRKVEFGNAVMEVWIRFRSLGGLVGRVWCGGRWGLFLGDCTGELLIECSV